MPAYKNKENGSWYVVTQYTDWTGERKPKCKRGFATRREALEWEQKFQQQSAGDLDMSFEAFYEIYTKDMINQRGSLHQRSQGAAERKHMADQGEYHQNKTAPVFRQAENQRDHHKRCDCMAKRAARLSG
jgi:hypothetical protein